MNSWETLEITDLPSVISIATELHPQLTERSEIFREKMELFPQGCKKFLTNDKITGYGLSHPWKLNSIPSLDSFLIQLPEQPNCLYIHDIAIIPEARGQRAAHSLLTQLITLAEQYGIGTISLVSVYLTTVFWERSGFKVVNDSTLDENLDTYGHTASYMILQL